MVARHRPCAGRAARVTDRRPAAYLPWRCASSSSSAVRSSCSHPSRRGPRRPRFASCTSRTRSGHPSGCAGRFAATPSVGRSRGGRPRVASSLVSAGARSSRCHPRRRAPRSSAAPRSRSSAAASTATGSGRACPVSTAARSRGGSAFRPSCPQVGLAEARQRLLALGHRLRPGGPLYCRRPLFWRPLRSGGLLSWRPSVLAPRVVRRCRCRTCPAPDLLGRRPPPHGS